MQKSGCKGEVKTSLPIISKNKKMEITKGIEYQRGDNGIQMLTCSDPDQVPVWREKIKEYKRLLKRKDCPYTKKSLEDCITYLELYIFLSGTSYSCKTRKKKI